MKFAGDFLPSQTIVRNNKTATKVFSQEGGFIGRWRGTQEQFFLRIKKQGTKFDQERNYEKFTEDIDKVEKTWESKTVLIFFFHTNFFLRVGRS